MRVPKTPHCKPLGTFARTALSCAGVGSLLLGAASMDWASDRVVSTGFALPLALPILLALAGVVALAKALLPDW